MDLKDNSKTIPAEELAKKLKLLKYRINAAQRSSINVKGSYDLYTLAFRDLVRGNLLDAFLQYEHANYELTNAVADAMAKVQGARVQSLKTLSFFTKLYGLYAVAFGVLSAAVFGILIFRYGNATLLDVPLWSAFFAGLGASAYILAGVADDLRKDGLVTRYKRVWYMILPLLGMVFGFMAYLLFSSGLLVFNMNSDSRISSTMFTCFLAGFLTRWFISKVSDL